MYYLRTKPAAKAIQFTVDKSYERREKQQQRNSLGDKSPTKPTSGSGSSSIEKGYNSEGSVSDDDDDDSGAGGGDEVYGEACISCSG